MKDIVVVYHKGCPDGFAGAWVAWTVLGDTAEYIPGVYQEDPPKELVGKTIYFIDFSYVPEVMRRLAGVNKKIVLLDHHATAQGNLAYAAPESVFQTNHSGAVIAWHYFHPNEAVPRFLQYIEDIDLWRWSLPRVRAAAAFLDMQEFTLDTLTGLREHFDSDMEFARLCDVGDIALEYKESLIRSTANGASLVSFEGYEALVVNASVLISEVASALYAKHPPLAIVWYEDSGGVRVSLRSDGSVDVSELAKRYGGGGHPRSSGFKLPLHKELPWKYLERPPAGFSGSMRGDV